MTNSIRNIYHPSKIKEDGFSLIEVLISLALVGLLVSVFLPIEGSSFSGIVKTGAARKDLYEAQEALERVIADETGVDGVKISPKTNITIQIPGENGPLDVPGKYMTSQLKSSKPITAFAADQDH